MNAVHGCLQTRLYFLGSPQLEAAVPLPLRGLADRAPTITAWAGGDFGSPVRIWDWVYLGWEALLAVMSFPIVSSSHHMLWVVVPTPEEVRIG